MLHIIKLFLILLLSILLGCTNSINGIIEEPKHNDDRFYIVHSAYSLYYNEIYEQADWVSYQLLSYELAHNYDRTNRFLEDTLVTTGAANNADYSYSGYDKGHLAPASDMTWNKQAMEESFFFSNISPQLPGFNRGIWKSLEIHVREWAKKYKCMYITTGPVCKGTQKTIGDNKVAIPISFFKTLLIYNDSIKQSICFMFPHKKCTGDIFKYAISVDSIELITGMDFYYSLPNKYEESIENHIDKSFWKEK